MADQNLNPGEICHTCGGNGYLDLIVTCDKCKKISSHLYCLKILLLEIPEQWYCEECIDHEEASNDPKGNFLSGKHSFERAKLESPPLTNAHAQPQTGKVKFIPEREITFFNDRKYFVKRPTEGKVKKTRRMTDLLGLSCNNKKKEVMIRDTVKEASQKNRELKTEDVKVKNLPASEVVWKGAINYFHFVKHTHDVQVHLAEKASQKVKEKLKDIPQKISLEVKHISKFWPEAFKVQPPSHEDIGLYFFSSDSDRIKEKFHRMIERLYKYKQVLVGRIGILALYLFPSQILPKYNQCINGECYLWGLLHRYEKKVQTPVTLCTTTSAKRENHDRASGCSQVKSNEMHVDMEIDMIGGIELSTTLTAKFASQPDPIIPPGFHRNHVNNLRNRNYVESDMARLTTSPGSQMSCSEQHLAV